MESAEQSDLPLSVILKLAEDELRRNGFRVTRDVGFTALPIDRALLAEDDYSVIAIVGFDTWSQLEGGWPDAQAELVTLLGKRLARSAPKAWDAYLVLVCTSAAPDHASVSIIERDTTRVRKIVADTLRTTSDVAHLLDPFMPLALPDSSADLPDILAALPDLLRNDVPIQVTQAVIAAFRQKEPLLERLNQLGDDI
jgi:hypothetical protein